MYLVFFNSESGFLRIKCDASNQGIGEIVEQKQPDNFYRPIALFSRKLIQREQSYSVGEKEALACVESIEYFYVYTYERFFGIHTDHHSLSFILNYQSPSNCVNERITRWKLRLSRYNFCVCYVKGNDNHVVNTFL